MISEKGATEMGAIFEAMVKFFEDDDWKFSRVEDRPILRMGFRGESGTWTCFAKAREEQEQMIFHSICPVNAPEDKRQAVAEFLTRANYGLVVGNFEMDFDDGEIAYKTSIDVEGDALSSALAKQIVYTNVLMMDKYLPGIMGVIYGKMTPAEAVKHVEE